MFLFILFLFQFAISDECYIYFNSDKNVLNYGKYPFSQCVSSGKGWEYDRNSNPKKFRFKSDCCENGLSYLSILINEAGSTEFTFDSDASIKQLFVRPPKFAAATTFKLQNYKSLLYIIVEREYCFSDTANQENLYIYDRPAVFHTTLCSKTFLIWVTKDRPYLYLYQEKNDTAKKEIWINDNNNDNTKEGCWYAFNTNGEQKLPDIKWGVIKEVSNINGFRRYVICQGQKSQSEEPQPDSSCKITTGSTDAHISWLTINYPDCLYNGSLYTLTVSNNYTTIRFLNDYGLEWNDIYFETRTSPLDIIISETNILNLILQSDTTIAIVSSGELNIITLETNTNKISITAPNENSLTISSIITSSEVNIIGVLSELNKLIISQNAKIILSSVITIDSVSVDPSTQTNTDYTIINQYKTTINEFTSTTKLSLKVSNLIFGPNVNSIYINKLTTDSQLTLSDSVTTLVIDSIEIQFALPSFFIITGKSKNELKVTINSASGQEDPFYLMSLKERKVTFTNSMKTMCDGQIAIFGTPGDESCDRKGYGTKTCYKRDESQYYYESESSSFFDYSCPGHISQYVTSTLYISASTITIDNDEYYSNIFVVSPTTITVSNYELPLTLQANVVIDGNGNSVLAKTNGKYSIITKGENNQNLIIADTSSCGITISSNLIEVDGICSIGYSTSSGTTCKKCRYGFNSDGSCIVASSTDVNNCALISPKSKYCLRCNTGYYMDKGECYPCQPNCLTCDSKQCFICEDEYINDKSDINKCIQDIKVCSFSKNGICLKCPQGMMIDNDHTRCSTSCGNNCYSCLDGSSCDICDITVNAIKSSTTCDVPSNSISVSNSGIIQCSPGYYLSESSTCVSCSSGGLHCMTCYSVSNNVFCSSCVDGYIMTTSGVCVSKESVSCSVVSKSTCLSCDDSSKYFNGKGCVSGTEHCLKTNNDGTCVECLFSETEEKYYLSTDSDGNTICSEQNDNFCSLYTKSVCRSCVDGYYNNQNKCLPCNATCSKCVNSKDSCYECQSGYILQGESCIVSETTNCKMMLVSESSQQCAICNDGYYRDGKVCSKCIENCVSCANANGCLMCINNYYFDIKTQKCLSTSLLSNCETTNRFGCEVCEDGYFLNGYTCLSCDKRTDECISCNKQNGRCNLCNNDYILDVDYKCSHYSQFSHCVSARNNICSKCDFWYSVDVDGKECKSSPVWWVIVLAIIGGIMFFILFIVFVIFIVRKTIKRLHIKQVIEEQKNQVSHFRMNTSNIKWIPLSGRSQILVNKRLANFGCGEYEKDGNELPVNEESRDIICIGNGYNKTIQLTFMTVDEIDSKYTLRCNPEQITLKKGEAFEAEIYITPLCTCTIKERLQITLFDIKNNKKTNESIQIYAATVVSTRLDYDEIQEEKQIGEGSFGVVFKGTFQGNKVAIKKMKMGDDEEAMEEFNKEVAMLDKFRCEYIVHFYGAVFIPTKICLVTEYADMGSLQSLINNHSKPNEHMRMKLVIDAAKGIQYLHFNGIIHRDIKPDNVLIFSLDDGIEVNAKLTDFGSSRNVNSMKTNMTFTKGIGTPVYMAPEILNQEKYTESADIFSFSILMYETFKWDRPYPENLFKYPWNIAEYVMQGNRLEITSGMPEWYFLIIQNSWKQNPSERYNIEQVIDLLNVGMN
ncbi:protein serine/threonine kinase, putative [Entamoeba dispar SAW760]|uniref:Protein serine/threonine kinase, putative n=1 Tax=Entamoeba dispar (strain ATCC PRA-260 / SAW760) TaxID=370354 RepID=B0ER58_ENTDS|nr:protein serine/threonine kinase, putative [Entamoeba dispar SAW760]EDR22987.1 protein serine/threonine kinase, putative [Entamoeba dispar SAW760]|eukprot:EDR22987.1 protein serine/threonine kinase, putative [Entamoeba dispar SAW760]